ncbi:tyrosine-type recombinase/integrase [Candidatus Enterococcus murrayae]|uniref:Site-specific integrase n=1 Tax=Candidatus Enterococcus murrayae TaxID=2815321 RepID=A0ABS3HEE5_9ENTE|nr:site-specific integrase [Enterococcus sp. MJM16]MBO0451819.1 site-specific integrase [Enterococcus sp. MJM16]
MSRRGENIYKRKDGRWEGRYQKGRTPDGKIKYGSVYGRSYQETKYKLYPLKIKYQRLISMHGTCAIPFYQWANHWLTTIRGTIKPATYASYDYKMIHFILPMLNDTYLNELDEAAIKGLLDSWKAKQFKESTIRVVFQELKSCLSLAVKQGYLVSNPCDQIVLPKQDKKRVCALSKKEQAMLERTLADTPLNKRLPVILALQTGMRIGEIAALQWKNVDFDSNVIHVEHTFQRIPSVDRGQKASELVLSSPKTSASKRLIPMSRRVRQELLKAREQRTGSFIISTKGGPSEPRLIGYHFHQLMKKAQLIGKHFHQLRHTFATRCVERNRDIASISALLGHSSTQMTLDTYSSALLEQRMKVIESIA